MLINTAEDQECRIAVMSDGRLEELYVERASIASHVGNIYKGRVTNVESAIQAAFVDFGLAKNGFLHISDIHPQYFPQGRNETEAVGRKRSHRERPPIQQCLRRGQEVVVQMTKEGIGTKGPTLTTYLSIPGRLLVMMPGMSRLGVSRKIEEDDLRQKARSILAEMTVPDDMGFIVRTAGADRSKRDLQRDLNYLLRLWKSVSEQIKRAKVPAEIYEESDLVTRTIRDIYSSDITRVICDDEADVRRVKELLAVALPRGKNVVDLYDGKEGLFHRYGLEAEIEKIYSHRVELASGGSIVIDQTEALVAIDVNSGRFRKHSDAETTALKINEEAAGEIARQLSLRDLGGVIIIDFIDMREERNRRAVERSLRTAIRSDRAKTKVLRISNFGIVEMTRQRLGPSLKSNMYHACRVCAGTGVIKSEESQALSIMRSLRSVCADDDVARVNVHVTPPVAHHLANYHRRQISELEAETEKTIIVDAGWSVW
ncbi:MAG: Rne/Rng family ribonuclease [Dehalococcoidia bacterium]|nr:Rne/Rng family ribonuclease [Dehalococcoidia bacterium]